MQLEPIIAVIVFVGLFTAWVIVPHQIKKHHYKKGSREPSEWK